MADNGWQRKFEDPIPLPNGKKLVTLRDAADYITGLPGEGNRPAGLASRNGSAVAGPEVVRRCWRVSRS